MNYQHSTISFAGLLLDCFITSDKSTWLTLTSLATALNIHRQTLKNWLNLKSDAKQGSTLTVAVGLRKKEATAYPVDIAVAFIDYMADKGNKECKALRSATLRADIERSIRESNGEVVTAAQHEEVRHSARLEYLQQWVKDNYHPVVNKDGLVVPFEGSVARQAGFDNVYESTIIEMEAHVARREVQIARGTWSEAQVAEERSGIEKYKQNILTLAQKLTN